MSVNKDKAVVNPFDGSPYMVPDLERGIILKNTIDCDVVVPADHTFMKRNTKIEAGIEVLIEEGGEFLAF